MFSTRLPRAVVLALLVVAPALVAQESQKYLLPPQNIVDVFDAEPPAQISVSPNKQQIALVKARAYPTIAELSQPMYRLAGARINPKTNGPHRLSGLPGTGINSIALKRIDGGAETTVTMPPQARISHVKFSPDGAHLAFLQTKDTGIELWIANTATGAAKAVITGSDRINATGGDPCDWLHDNVTIVCELVPANRGAAPGEPMVPSGPTVHENYGKAAPAPTYEDLLKNPYDDALFEYYFTSQLAAINTATGTKTTIGKPGIFNNVTPSPSGQYVLVSKIKKPFSHTVPANGFNQDIEVWSRDGDVKKLADRPSREGTTLTGVEAGPRSFQWRADQPATVLWVEALDGGDNRAKVPFRDKIVSLAAPFSGQPTEITKTEWRYTGISYTDTGIGLLNENDRASRRTRTWLMEPGTAPRKVWDRKQDAAYDDPGNPVIRRDTGTAGRGGGGGRGGPAGGPIMQSGDFVFVAGQGASPEGDRPFLDKLNIKTLKTERVFRSSSESLESFIAPLNDEMTRFITRYETQKDAPNYYTRKDGVTLSGTLYLPPGYKQGTKVPVIMWAYPREFGDADSASQVTGSPNSFTQIRGASHMFLLLSGYAIFDNPTMPIIGPGETANDTYVEQLVASAQAAVDKVVEMGVTDRDRIGVGGHSYGGFMTANLLAHSRLFRAGFAESGAYNRSLTPFGFQSERRTFWEVPDLYAKMSPFWYANQIKDPILLMHGEADDNTGTYPINSERLFAAIKGHGGTVRLVMLPNEAHGYAARETLLHVLAERVNCFDKYVKNPGT